MESKSPRLINLLLPIVLIAAPAGRAQDLRQPESALVDGQVLAVAYSGYREGQHPDRGAGASNPSDAEVLEDLRLLVDAGFGLVRLYDAGENSAAVLRLIDEHGLPVTVLLGAWLRAESSNHEGCPWLTEPIPEATLRANTALNDAEVARAVELARAYPEIVVAVNVGSEALVGWTDHLVPEARVLELVGRVRGAIEQPVTVAENYEWWAAHGATLADAVDFVGVHTYPQWEDRTVDQAMAYTVENLQAVRAALPGHPLAVLEAGWATTAREFGSRAGEAQQERYLRELRAWAEETHVTVFVFEAFDEPWKGDPEAPDGAEKHWGLFFVDRTAKQAIRAWLDGGPGNDPDGD